MKFALAAIILSIALGAIAETTNVLSEAEIQGQQLAQEILEQQPTKNLINSGILEIRSANGITTNFTMKCETIVLSNGWQNIYEATTTNLGDNMHHLAKGNFLKIELFVNHIENQMNSYEFEGGLFTTNNSDKTDEVVYGGGPIIIRDLFRSFALSDFWICDLGLEFFHWPEQKILKHEMRRSRECKVLESINPNPSTNGYSRVVSWIDDETLGIVHAEAYDAKGKLLKVFDPKSFKKVNGQWELQDMEIRNVQTGSRTRIEFNLDKK